MPDAFASHKKKIFGSKTLNLGTAIEERLTVRLLSGRVISVDVHNGVESVAQLRFFVWPGS